MTENQGKNAGDPGAGFRQKWVYSALRELHETLTRPLYWAIMATSVALTVVAGPFDTLDQMNLPVRVLFWGVGIMATGLMMTALIIGSRHFNHDRRHPWPLVSTLAALIGVPPAFALFYGLATATTLQGPPQYPLRLLVELSTILVLISIVGNARIYLRRTPQAADEAPAPPAEPDTALPLLLEKLPPELGRELICLRAQDHYVEVVTPRGSTTLLMRLSDAERDLAGLDGLRVHRSWWVNLDHVVGFARTEAGGMELTTSTGLTIPVARGQRAVLKAALDQRQAAAE